MNERLKKKQKKTERTLGERERGAAYDELLDELVSAIQARYGARTIIHWEDFAPRNAFRNLTRFQEKGARTYNDDIQADGLRLFTINITISRIPTNARCIPPPPMSDVV